MMSFRWYARWRVTLCGKRRARWMEVEVDVWVRRNAQKRTVQTEQREVDV